MFAYCGNNPISNTDISGTMHERTAGGAVCGGGRGNGQKLTWNKELEDFLLYIARERTNGSTLSAGVSGGTSMGGLANGKSYVLSTDTSSNYALQETTTLGASTGTGGNLGLILTYTNAPDVQDLSGISNSWGATVVIGKGLSVDFITFSPESDPNKTYRGVSIVFCFGAEADFHGAENYTTSTDSWNPFIALKEYLFGA